MGHRFLRVLAEHHSFSLQLSLRFYLLFPLQLLCFMFLLLFTSSPLPFSLSYSLSIPFAFSTPSSQSLSPLVLWLSPFIHAHGVRDPGVRCCMSSSTMVAVPSPVQLAGAKNGENYSPQFHAI